jgi:4a-hydroxytetrahydrobiopterin dehydratase
MKLFSPKGKPLSRATAKNAAFLNLLAWPGLGSLMGRRWISGTAELLIFLAGFLLFCGWALTTIVNYYRQGFSENPPAPIHWGGKALLGLVLCVVSWVWSAMTSFSLLNEASAGGRSSMENFAAPPPLKLEESKILPLLALIPKWQFDDGKILRTYEFKNFPAAIKFVETVAALAEQAWHHPDIDIRWNKVVLTLTTHDAGGLTEKDFALAQKFDRV